MKASFRLIAFLAAAAALYASPVRAATTTIDGRIVIPVASLNGDTEGDVLQVKSGLLSSGGEISVRVQRAMRSNNGVIASTSSGAGRDGERHDSDEPGPRRNVQINDPALDYVSQFPFLNIPPFEFATQSETSMVSRGRDIVVGYNSSAGGKIEFFPGFGLFYTQLLFSGYSASHDGGRTWKSGFVPGVSPGSPFTFGDPSLAMDRTGNVFYASIGQDEAGNGGLIINKSTDLGDTWGFAGIVVLDNGADKEWLAIGPDPEKPSRDNLYVTWTSFQAASSELWLARSTDGGATWTSKRLFAPADDGLNSALIQFSNPVVDPLNGRLYVPFLHFSDIDADNVRMLVSDDAGETFSFVAFNVAGAFDPFAFPNLTPGVLNDCGLSGFRNVLKQGTSPMPGSPFPLPGYLTFSYVNATRLVSQPSAAVLGGKVYLAINSSTSIHLGDPSAGSEIRVLYSPNGGTSWAKPLSAAPSTKSDPQHVHPSIAIGGFGETAYVGYYVQQADEKLRTDIATLEVDDGKVKVKDHSRLSSVAFDFPPTNIILAVSPRSTTNFDQTIVECYDIGEYMSVNAPAFWADDSRAMGAWGDNRRSWTGPAGPPPSVAPYTHPQADVFFGHAGGDD